MRAGRTTSHCIFLIKILAPVCILLLPLTGVAQKKIIPLHAKVPAGEKWNWDELETNNTPLQVRIAYNITKPTLTVFAPDTANGTAVIVCPGGGFHVLNIEHEGEQIAKQLSEKGITAFLLRYRVVHSLTDDPWKEMMNKMQDSARFQQTIGTAEKMATEDLKTAIKYLRSFAAELKIDPKRIGVIGFSAGGTLAINLSMSEQSETKPDFTGIINSTFNANERIAAPLNAPPAFIAAASDDKAAISSNSAALYHAWIASQNSAELYIHTKRGDRLQPSAGNSWIERFMEWLRVKGF